MTASRVLTFAGNELRVGFRNRWVVTAIVVLTVFAIVLALAGSAPTGSTAIDPLTVLTVSLTSLSVYIVPLLALLLAFDAFAGERERGTLSLLLTYPVGRHAIVLGKFVGHSVILGSAVIVGFGIAAALVLRDAEFSSDGLAALLRLAATATLLGMTFLALGYVLSAMVRQATTAAALSVGLWLGAVVLFDLVLLSALVADDGGVFTKQIFPWLLVGNPADGFRLFNMASLPDDSLAIAGALAPGVDGPSPLAALAALAAWTAAALLLAIDRVRRIQP